MGEGDVGEVGGGGVGGGGGEGGRGGVVRAGEGRGLGRGVAGEWVHDDEGGGGGGRGEV